MVETASLKLIDEICKEKGISEKKISFGWIRELEKDGKIRHIVRNTFDLNPASSYDIVNDKYATYEVLKSNGIDVLEHIMIFNPFTRKEFARDLNVQADEILKKYNNKVVLKANSSSEGKNVYFVHDKENFLEIVSMLFQNGSSGVSACPYIDIDVEYRVIVLEDEIEYIYKKEKPYVIGDGKKTIKELIASNQLYVENYLDANNSYMMYVPKIGEKIVINWKHNLYSGAKVNIDFNNDIYFEAVKKLAKKAQSATNIKFASIDISRAKSGDIFVMEINGTVCMSKFIEIVPDGKNIAKNIYSKAIDKMFT